MRASALMALPVLCGLSLPTETVWADASEASRSQGSEAGPVSSSLDDHVALTGHSLADRVQLQPTSRVSVTQSAAEPLATSRMSAAGGTWYGRSAMARQTMVWGQPFATHGLRVGVGVEQRAPAIGGGLYQTPYQSARPGAAGDAGVLVGLAMPMSANSHVFVQTPLVDSQRAAYEDVALNGHEAEGRQVRVGMVFNSRKAYADLRKGLRMELSGQSSLAVKPRGGGKVALTFQKLF